jgi:hypothetical protein
MRKLGIIAVLSLLVVALGATAAFAVHSTSFRMVRSQAAVANDCLEGAKANVDVRTTPTDQQIMDVTVNHAPKNTEFEVFVTQQANAPFGVSWYQSDFDTNGQGSGEVRARGIFSEELFAVAPGSVAAPQVDDADAETSEAFAPVHTYHVGLWFGSPEEKPRPRAARPTSRPSMVTTARASRRLARATSASCTDPCAKSSSFLATSKGDVGGDAKVMASLPLQRRSG